MPSPRAQGELSPAPSSGGGTLPALPLCIPSRHSTEPGAVAVPRQTPPRHHFISLHSATHKPSLNPSSPSTSGFTHAPPLGLHQRPWQCLGPNNPRKQKALDGNRRAHTRRTGLRPRVQAQDTQAPQAQAQAPKLQVPQTPQAPGPSRPHAGGATRVRGSKQREGPRAG